MLAAGVLMLVSVFGGLADVNLGKRQLLTADDYMRFARVMDLLEGRTGWFSDTVTWSNTPFGTTMHWTRPLDGILVVLSLPFRPFMDQADAVYWGSLVSASLLLLGAVTAVGWAARSVVPLPAAVLAAFVTGVQPAVAVDALAGRIDHHVLLLGAFAVMFGVAIRLVRNEPACPVRPLTVTGGLVAAFGVWVSGEALIGVALLLATLGLDWLVRGGRSARRLAEVAGWWTVGSFVAPLAERGPGGALDREYDRMSFAHVAIALGVTVAGGVIVGVERSIGPQQRVLARGAIAVGAFLMVGLAVPWLLNVDVVDLAGAPYSLIPDDVREFWLAELVEFGSVRSTAVATVVALFTVPVVGLVLAMRLASDAADRPWRRAWVVVVGWAAATTVLGLYAIRLAVYPEAVAAVPVAAFAWSVLERIRPRHGLRSIVARAAVVMAALVGFLVPAAAVAALSGSDDEADDPPSCDLGSMTDEILRWRAQSEVPADGPTAVLTQLDLANPLHHLTGVDVVGTGHHRNVEGIRAVRDTFRAPPDVALREIERRGIDLVAV